MANIAIISKTPDSLLPENIPTTIISVAKLFNFRWQYTLFKLSALTPARALRRGGDHSIAEASVINV